MLGKLICPYCFKDEDSDFEVMSDKSIRCPYCRRIYTRETAEGVYQKVVDSLTQMQVKNLENAVKILNREAMQERPDVKLITDYAKEVQNLSPEHPFANMYLVLYSQSDASRVSNFFKEISSHSLSLDSKRFIVECFTERFRHAYSKALREYIKKEIAPFDASLGARLLSELQIEETKLTDGTYNCELLRDVFICYKSEEQDLALAIVDALESDNKKCWISCRNLSKKTDDYWAEIEKAIHSTSIFVVISSEHAMKSDDIAKEMKIADRYKKPRLEYKIDYRNHTRSFRDFFYGISWIDAAEDNLGKIEELCERIHQKINLVEKQNQSAVIPSAKQDQSALVMPSIPAQKLLPVTDEPNIRMIEAENDSKRRREIVEIEADNLRKQFRNKKPGAIFEFGAYPQTAMGNDYTPIRWLVLENNGNELFMISEKILDYERFHYDTNNRDITWQNSDIRKWLNGRFYNKAFSPVQKSVIKQSHTLGNGANSKNNLTVTDDYVFLMNTAEVEKYFTKGGVQLYNAKAASAKETGYAFKNNSFNLSLSENRTYDWWLRNRGAHDSVRAAYVNDAGKVVGAGTSRIADKKGVRPAIKLNLRGTNFNEAKPVFATEPKKAPDVRSSEVNNVSNFKSAEQEKVKIPFVKASNSPNKKAKTNVGLVVALIVIAAICIGLAVLFAVLVSNTNENNTNVNWLSYSVNGKEAEITGLSPAWQKYTGTENKHIITIPEKINGCTVTSIAPFAFEGQTKIMKITIPDSVKIIGDSAFAYTSITEISIPKAEIIGYNILEGCFIANITANEAMDLNRWFGGNVPKSLRVITIKVISATWIDFYGGGAKLEKFVCINSDIAHIFLSEFASIDELLLYGNKLSTLILDNDIKIKKFDISGNMLSESVIAGAISFTYTTIQYLDISKNGFNIVSNIFLKSYVNEITGNGGTVIVT